jgi:hypothetical protein
MLRYGVLVSIIVGFYYFSFTKNEELPTEQKTITDWFDGVYEEHLSKEQNYLR